MTVAQLIEKLQQFPQELDVCLYHGISEDGDMVNTVSQITEDNEPYCKGDSLYSMFPTLSNPAVLIS